MAAHIEPYGDGAFLVCVGGGASAATAARVRALDEAVAALRMEGLGERIAGYATLAVTYDPLRTDPARVRAGLASALEAALSPAAGAGGAPPRSIQVPVVYGGADGPDLEAVARERGVAPREVVARHAGRPYRVLFVGFSPGFAYLGDVDPVIAAPRLAVPRRAVPAGAVGVAGRQTGVYPRPSPGGWRLLGRTPLVVYDAARREPALFRQGDEVVFLPAEGAVPAEVGGGAPESAGAAERGLEGAAGAGAPPGREDSGPAGAPAMQVVRPGLFTTIQDGGRVGHQAEGVPPAGAADPVAARLANRLVGNAPDAAVLEVTALGPHLRPLRGLALALCGGDLGARIDGAALPPGRAAAVARGAEVTFTGGPRTGCRAYLAVAGGWAAPSVLGSRSADVLSGLGPAPLRAGDVLGAYPTGAAPGDVAGRRLREGVYAAPETGACVEVGVLPGPQQDWFREDWYAGVRPVASASDRVGVRLEGPPLERAPGWAAEELLSEPNVLGAVQVPPDGHPVVLMAGRPTVGGYPKPGVACTVDCWRLAQVLPGAGRVRLVPTDPREARRRLAAAEALAADPGAVVG